ncbi:MAG: hypothetical protein JSV67_04675 [Thermoplasmatales archaeon]|nr:MAG: hypothetical protein JSV67_04675 [Thermoplasmatales archaeon]
MSYKRGWAIKIDITLIDIYSMIIIIEMLLVIGIASKKRYNKKYNG